MDEIAPRPQNPTLTGTLPLDRPTHSRPHRLYVALTNHCNRACPWCSTCSSPRGKTFLSVEALLAQIPREGSFEVQLEGGEPTLHPDFLEIVDRTRAVARCTRIVIVTNGVVIPRSAPPMREWLARLGAPLTIKLSINHYLLAHDPGLIPLAQAMRRQLALLGGDRQLVLNVRLRPEPVDVDSPVREVVAAAGLMDIANVFYLQACGFARQLDWEKPFLVGTNFTLVNPDGTTHGTDLLERAEAMRRLSDGAE